MISDKIISKEELIKSIEQNICNRNNDLAALVRIINYASRDSAIIGLDGGWGSGKTFLIKQYELLWEIDNNPLQNRGISTEDIETLHNKIYPFYYNAWENDYFADACQSLLLTLAESIDENKNALEKSERALLQSIDLKSYLKEKTKGLINLGYAESSKDVVQYAAVANKTKKMRAIISTMMTEKIQLKDNCKLLFIIDDLDRCRPSYAVELIETIKNCFNNDQIVFLIAANFPELGNIIKGYYGGHIDGHQYLDRIFDLRIHVSDIDQESYIRYRMPNMQTYAIKNVATNLKLNMRELNRLLDVARLYESYWENSSHFAHDQNFYNVCRYIFIPIFISYKIKNHDLYERLISSSGYEVILEYLNTHSNMRDYVLSLINTPTNTDGINILEEYYDKLFSNNIQDRADANQYFWNILNLTSPSLDL